MKHLLLVVLISLVLLGAAGCGRGSGGYGPVGEYVVPYRDENFTVKPFTATELTINISNGAVLEGYVTVRGGNDDIRFYIKDSYGNKVLDINRVQGRYDFFYRATSEGFHTIYLDNSFSIITSKQVYMHYRVR